jgi:hypothetical protein
MATETFTALVLSLPSADKTARMRIWRALRALGCGVLRDGVYLLPGDSPRAVEFAKLEAQVKAAGGFAMTVDLVPRSAGQLAAVRKLFERTPQYSELTEQIHAARKALAQRGTDGIVKRLRRSLQEIAAIDFYPGQAGRQAADALAALESALEGQRSPGEPRGAQAAIRRLDRMKYQGRIWATRKNPWIDRLASAWLIKRFIDPKARFRWIDKPRDRPKGAVGFDFDGAEFTHVDNRVTFEELLASFGLESDAALKRLAATIHFLDVGGIPVADAGGLEMVLKGARGSARSDDQLAAAAAAVFEHVYSAYRAAEALPA